MGSGDHVIGGGEKILATAFVNIHAWRTRGGLDAGIRRCVVIAVWSQRIAAVGLGGFVALVLAQSLWGALSPDDFLDCLAGALILGLGSFIHGRWYASRAIRYEHAALKLDATRFELTDQALYAIVEGEGARRFDMGEFCDVEVMPAYLDGSADVVFKRRDGTSISLPAIRDPSVLAGAFRRRH